VKMRVLDLIGVLFTRMVSLLGNICN
jgi:hypothetical protein